MEILIPTNLISALFLILATGVVLFFLIKAFKKENFDIDVRVKITTNKK